MRLQMTLIVAMSFSTAVSADIFQCRQANGQMVFSDRACADNARIVTVDPVVTGGRLDTGTDVETWQPASRERRREPKGCDQGYIQSTQLRTFRARRQVQAGMSAKQVRYILGEPDVRDGQWWVYEHKGEETGRYKIVGGCLDKWR
ncbi:hypothetical protein RE428_46660 [Marinobacter nanhaiticus D15-8W]|uniref:DUF4124 domain-containing protein n=1 Tax=Marinobacter nanhaiticus D15-8W TaxID=626887 RepID=N6X345_9GAMM|nr:DUF4124 domain-containing protein [Marinobacter nanhaiticus]ENO15503.1 DUF4124 domain-containing protein [Marinobacter nanhaiticus D15-8W]BES73648.1 hypothetical protein RE428_46660 [Marinobacter nanhaiticus D15-8W]